MSLTNYTKNFTDEELRCHCGCGSPEMPRRQSQERLQRVRDLVGFPMPLTSAKRCRTHPIEAGKKSPGTHFDGFAFDSGNRGAEALKLLEIAKAEGFHRIGVSQKGINRFIHMDDAPIKSGRPAPHIWSY